MQLNVCEIFYSLQGESSYMGMPCVFIRLAGCNLHCSWCDTPYAMTESVPMGINAILSRIETHHCGLVEITGGEPLMQQNTPNLISELIRMQYKVLLETNGSKSILNLDPECIKILDIKCPSSNESDSLLEENLSFLSVEDEVKFVIADRRDYEYAVSMINSSLTGMPAEKIHLSPVWGRISFQSIAEWMIQDHLHARLSLQQHKIIWNPEKRGV